MEAEPIYDILKREHEEVSELFHRLKEAKGKTGPDILAKIKDKLVPHSRGEEAVFYRQLLQTGATAEKVRESLEEHRQIDLLLTELEKMSPKDANWLAKASVLAEMVGHHVDEEEGELFPLARQVLSDRESRVVGRKYEAARDEARGELGGAEQRGAAE